MKVSLFSVADQILSNIIKDLETAVYKLKVYADSRSLVGSEGWFLHLISYASCNSNFMNANL